jgi:hypothetical protein
VDSYAFTNAPTISMNGIVYVQSFDYLYALDETTGATLWTAYTYDTYFATPAVTGDGVYASDGVNINKFDPSSGSEIWTSANSQYDNAGATPVVYNGRVYAMNGGGGIFDAPTGAGLGTFVSDTTPAFAAGQGYFVHSGALVAQDPLAQSTAWSFSGSGTGNFCAPIFLNGHVYIGTTGGALYAVNALTGAQEWTANLPITNVPEEGTVGINYLTAAAGTLVVPVGPTLYAYSYTVTPSPIVDAVSAGVVTGTTAAPAGSINPNGADTIAYFEYGTDATYGSQTASTDLGSGAADAALTASITGLSPNVTYHFALVATNSAGTTTTPDQTFTTGSELSPTVTTNAATGETPYTATLSGSVNPNGLDATVYFQYGPTNAYGMQTASVDAGTNSLAATISATLTGLSPNTTYHYSIVAENSTGTSMGADQTFATQPLIAPSFYNVYAENVYLTTASLYGYIDANGLETTAYFEYGTDTTYGTNAASTTIYPYEEASLYTNLSNLTPGQTYHFQIVATNADGTFTSGDQTFTTPTGQPAISEVSVATAGITTAALECSLDPGYFSTTYYVEYGPDTNYGSSTTPTAFTGYYYDGYGIDVSVSLTGLTGGATYHYRFVATNSGGTTYSSDATFTTYTPADEPTAVTGPASGITDYAATLSGTVNPDGVDTTYYFEYGLDQTYGNTTTGEDVGSGTSPVAASSAIGGNFGLYYSINLSPNTTYHYRLDATNAAGTAYGLDQTFTTFATAPPYSIILDNISAYTAPKHSITINVFAGALSAAPATLSIVSVSQGLVGAVVINSNQTLTYVPGSDFQGLDTFNFTVTDATGSVASAVVTVHNLKTSAAGNYSGLIGDSNSGFASSGLLSVALLPTGAFTGKLLLAGNTFALKGTLAADGSYSCPLKDNAHNPITLSFQMEPGLGGLTGGIVYAGANPTVSAIRNPYNAIANPAPEAGSYTLILPPSSATGGAQGFGSVVMNVGANGVVTLVGRLQNGAGFSTSAMINPTGLFPVYAAGNPSTEGSIHGNMVFSTSSRSDCAGAIGWSIGSSSTAPAQITALGSRYIRPAPGNPILQCAYSAPNTVVALEEPDFSGTPKTLAATLTGASTLVPAGGDRISLSVNSKTGLFTGAFLHPTTKKMTKYIGVIFQRQNAGCGSYRSAGAASGSIVITPTGSSGLNLSIPTDTTTPGGLGGGGLPISIGGGGLIYYGGGSTEGGTLTLDGTLSLSGSSAQGAH